VDSGGAAADPYALSTFLNLHEAEALARARLPAAIFDYFAGGACDEITLAGNRRVFDAIALRYRVLVDVSRRELGMARAAGSLGLLMAASTFSTNSLEEIAAEASGPLWFQLYVHQDRGITRDLVQRAKAAGYRALVLTVDVPEVGRRASSFPTTAGGSSIPRSPDSRPSRRSPRPLATRSWS